MRAMDFIKSKNICYLISDILRLMSDVPADHGIRLAYMLMRMLETKGGYDEYEVAEFSFLAMIHDIGVYKFGEISQNRTVWDKEKVSEAHAVYGGLFLKQFSHFGERADIISYHHLPYKKLVSLNYKYLRIASYIQLLEDLDALYVEEGAELDYHLFESQAGTRYNPEAVMIMMKCIRREGMLLKLEKGEHLQELSDYMDNVLFTNEEKDILVKMAMHCMSLYSLTKPLEGIMTARMCEMISEQMGLSMREKEKMYYASILRDVGMIAVPKNLTEAPRELSKSEMKSQIVPHVVLGLEVIQKWFAVQEIADIVGAHHERLDGSGYPNALKERDMTINQIILQTSDVLSAMMSKRAHRPVLSKDEIFDALEKMVDHNRIHPQPVIIAKTFYDKIKKTVDAEMQEYMDIHNRLNNRYKTIINKENVAEY